MRLLPAAPPRGRRPAELTSRWARRRQVLCDQHRALELPSTCMLSSFFVQARTAVTLSATSSSSLRPKECTSKEQMRSPTSVSLSSLRPLGGPGPPGWGGWSGKAFSRRTACLLAGSLSAFVCQHSIMALALPCKLTIPKKGGSGPPGGGIQTPGLFALARKAPSGHISPYLWVILVSQFKVRALGQVCPTCGLEWL